MRLGPEGQGENSFSGFKTPAIVKARECLNKEVGEGCPGEESQLKDCQERNCPGRWMGWDGREGTIQILWKRVDQIIRLI